MIAPSDILAASTVAVARDADAVSYPPISTAPFHPSEKYPEYRGELSAIRNRVYSLVRDAMRELGLDAKNFGTAEWNPIRELVPAGAKIVVKPNWVLHRNEGGGGTDELISHASVLRAILDYVFIARPARVVVGDAPLQICDEKSGPTSSKIPFSISGVIGMRDSPPRIQYAPLY